MQMLYDAIEDEQELNANQILRYQAFWDTGVCPILKYHKLEVKCFVAI